MDHPHGGGEGKSTGGRHPVSPKGQSVKDLKTRDNKRTDKFIIRRRKKRGIIMIMGKKIDKTNDKTVGDLLTTVLDQVSES